ncbi:MAG: DUF308 domain-containing protein [Prevotella sp.]|nr:DUF308 domain-containing protein [Prevotella sp.]
MKVLQSSIFRAACSVIVGAMLIKYPADTATWLVIAMGVLFLLSGVISCAVYISARRKDDGVTVLNSNGKIISGGTPPFPIVGVGSVILGLLLALRPHFVMGAMGYVFGAILILGAINQIVSLVSAGRVSRIPVVFWICPAVILIVGLIAVVHPVWIASAPLVILGWCLLLYGVTEVINALKINADRRRFERFMRQASVSNATNPGDNEYNDGKED